MPKSATTNAMPTEYRVAEITSLIPELWGVQFGGRWWVDDNGIVFYTPYEIIAKIQASIIKGRGLECEPKKIQ